MLLTIEKVLLLKSVDIFAETQERALSQVAEILEEMDFEAGETIVTQGDVGRSMYILVRGRARVHVGDHTLSEISEGSVFGELAALDPEPRSASVTALDDVQLFRLDNNALFELMAEHTDVIHSIVRVLCQRIRAKNTRALQAEDETV